MSKIVFYNCTPSEQQIFLGKFDDHKVVFKEDALTLDNVVKDADIVSVFVSSKVTGEIIEAFDHLKLIACRSTGHDNIDYQAAKAKSIPVANVPSYGENTVAEFAFGLLLTLTRKLRESFESALSGRIEHETSHGTDLAGKTFGIIGSGKIGCKAARIANGFEMKVIAYDPFPDESRAKEHNFTYVNLEQLLSTSDIVSLHAPLTAENHHLLDHARLGIMKRGSYLINTARGELIDNQALITELEAGRFAGVGLDVIEGEKLLDVHEELASLRSKEVPQDTVQRLVELDVLTKYPQVAITSHNAFNTVEAIGRINQTTIDNIRAFLDGQPQNLVVIEPKSIPVTTPSKQSGKLVIVRHGESEWNALGKWTGTTDVHESAKGFAEDAKMGVKLHDIKFDYAYCSEQVRTLETLEGILDASEEYGVPYERAHGINERDYGIYTGKNKWEVQKEIGEEAFDQLRRGWNYSVKDGETLKDVYERAIPFYLDKVVPRLSRGENVLIVGHGNSIRSLVKYIESIPDDKISEVEMIFGTALIYTVDDQGKMATKEVRQIDTTPPPA